MDAVDEFPGSFFKAAEMKGKKVTLTIAGAAKEQMNDGKFKLILSFKEDQRRLVLNVGNRTALVERFGRNTDDWVGEQVTLVTQRVNGPNGLTWGIRFADTTDIAAEIDDEIPPTGGGTDVSTPPRKRDFM